MRSISQNAGATQRYTVLHTPRPSVVVMAVVSVLSIRSINMFRLIVAGSRGFWSQDLMNRKLDHLLHNKSPDEIEIVSGNSRGADRFGEVYAHSRGYKVTVMPAEWNKHGKSAGTNATSRWLSMQMHVLSSGMVNPVAADT